MNPLAAPNWRTSDRIVSLRDNVRRTTEMITAINSKIGRLEAARADREAALARNRSELASELSRQVGPARHDR